MITISDNLISDYASFIGGTFDNFLPIVGMVAGVFLAFTIFDKIVRIIIKAVR